MRRTPDEFIDSLADNNIPIVKPVEEPEIVNKNDTNVNEPDTNIEKKIETQEKEIVDTNIDEPKNKVDEGEKEPSEVDDLKGQIEKAEDRRRGSETSFNEANKAKLNALKEVDLLKTELETIKAERQDYMSKADKEFASNFETQYEADPEGSVREAVKLLLDRTSNQKPVQEFDMDEVMRKQRIIADEAIMKREHSDFENVIDIFLSESQSNSTILDKWNESGQSVAKAYELGKPFFEAREIVKDPEAYKEKLRKEILEEKESSNKTPEKTRVSSLNSSGKPPKAADKIHDDLKSSSSVLASLGIPGF